MNARAFKISLTTASLLGSLFMAYSASGSVARPEWDEVASCRADYIQSMQQTARTSQASHKRGRLARAALNIKMRIFAKFRPDNHLKNYSAEEAALKKTFFSDLFNKDLSRDMRGRYQEVVAPYEAKINSPYRQAQVWERAKDNENRHNMASWTAKEVLDRKLKDLFRNADHSSSAMQVISAVRTVTGGNPDDFNQQPLGSSGSSGAPAKRGKPLTQEQKIALAHQLPPPPPEEKIPTKLKTRINVIQKKGSLYFTNPIVITEMNLDMTDTDKLTFKLAKDFRALKMRSNAEYGIRRKILKFNLNKTITDRISLDLDTHRYTGSEKSPSGKNSQESARLNYSVSF